MIMKKNILYLLAFITVAFAACNPLKDEINNLKPAVVDKTVVIASTSNYQSVALANTGISALLNKSYLHLPDGTKANVTYNSVPTQIKAADSLLASTGTTPTQYTVLAADYPLVSGNSNLNFNTANVIKFLDIKFPSKVENQLIVLTYNYFENGAVNPAVQVTETFLYLNGAWTKAYQVTQAQYASVGKVNVFNFGSADEPNLVGYFNTFLKSDASVSGKAKVGDVKNVSFTYFSSSKLYQRIKALIFDGVNWGTKPVPASALSFLKKNGTWIPDPTVYYTLVVADFAVLNGDEGKKIGTDAARANAIRFASFDVTGGGNNWTEDEIMNVLLLILKTKYPNAPIDETVLYKITYGVFKGSVTPTVKSFAKTSTGFVFVPE
ncbi:hypothetical protein D3C87_195870 [compost metagenome]